MSSFYVIAQLEDTLSEPQNSEYHHCFNEHDSFSMGGAGTYSINFKLPGLNARGYYNVNHRICFGPEFSYLQHGNKQLMEINFVVHYIFELPWLGVYPVVGGNYSFEKSSHANESAPGLLMGAGIHRNLNRWIIFSEYTHIEGQLRDNFLTLGLLYTF